MTLHSPCTRCNPPCGQHPTDRSMPFILTAPVPHPCPVLGLIDDIFCWPLTIKLAEGLAEISPTFPSLIQSFQKKMLNTISFALCAAPFGSGPAMFASGYHRKRAISSGGGPPMFAPAAHRPATNQVRVGVGLWARARARVTELEAGILFWGTAGRSLGFSSLVSPPPPLFHLKSKKVLCVSGGPPKCHFQFWLQVAIGHAKEHNRIAGGPAAL